MGVVWMYQKHHPFLKEVGERNKEERRDNYFSFKTYIINYPGQQKQRGQRAVKRGAVNLI